MQTLVTQILNRTLAQSQLQSVYLVGEEEMLNEVEEQEERTQR